jgi:hypothetical protein
MNVSRCALCKSFGRLLPLRPCLRPPVETLRCPRQTLSRSRNLGGRGSNVRPRRSARPPTSGRPVFRHPRHGQRRSASESCATSSPSTAYTLTLLLRPLHIPWMRTRRRASLPAIMTLLLRPLHIRCTSPPAHPLHIPGTGTCHASLHFRHIFSVPFAPPLRSRFEHGRTDFA